MGMTLNVKVTKRDITSGTKFRADMCPVALALKRSGISDPHVGMKNVWNRQYRAKLPSEAVSFIHTFDRGGGVAPFSFTLSFEDILI